MNIDVVIGAGYGDEGKGATVNKLATEKSLVVRFNGGCQAGHTVEHNNIRHVFSHFGSGTLRGAGTFLSSPFVCSPLAFDSERKALLSHGICTRINKTFVSKECLVSTPWDVFINRTLEDSRGNNKHGSVGVGFNETIERCQHEEFRLTINDLKDHSSYGSCQKLKAIAEKWIYKRACDLNIDIDKPLTRYYFDIDSIWYLCQNMLSHITVVDDEEQFMRDNIEKNQHIIFEGAQGLMIDQTYGNFPYVTRSNCGLKNVLPLVPIASDMYVTYVTRAYTTRHGVGPLPWELNRLPYPDIVDKTNLYNRYQGELRFSYLNLDTLNYSINRDLSEDSHHLPARLSNNIWPCGHMTCLDQIKGNWATAILNNELITTSSHELYDLFLSATGLLDGGINDE